MNTLNFPSSPSINDIYTENKLSWRWDGETWNFISSSAGVTDHGDLIGLSDDDHTQYLLVNGSRAANSLEITNDLIVYGNLGMGVSSPGAILDVGGTGSGVSLKIRNGDSAAGESAIQALFTYSGAGDYGHSIRTQHSSSTNADNAINFYLWTTSDSSNTPGSTKVLTIDGAGDVTVSGDIIVGGTVDGVDVFAHANNNDIHIVAGTITGQVATWNNSTGAWEAQTPSSGVTDHSLLTGLSDDDHTQYLLADGSRTLSGNLNVTGTVDGRDIAADGAKLDSLPGVDVNSTVTTSTHTLGSADVWKATKYNNSSLVTVTIPTDTFSSGDWFLLQSTGAGGLTLSTTGLVVDGSKNTIAQGEGLMILFMEANTISVFGGTS